MWEVWGLVCACVHLHITLYACVAMAVHAPLAGGHL